MGILDNIDKAANALGSARVIHQNAAYFADQASQAMQNGKSNPTNIKVLTFEMPSTGQVDEWILCHGQAPPHSIIELYSQHRLEGSTTAQKDGTWYKNLYFSVKGKYEIKAKWNYKVTSSPKYIEIS